MALRKRHIIGGFLVWVTLITVLHLTLNFDWSSFLNERLPPEKRKLVVGYIPVT